MYYILWTTEVGQNVWELISGEDAMLQRVDEIMRQYHIDDPADILVFSLDDELDNSSD